MKRRETSGDHHDKLQRMAQQMIFLDALIRRATARQEDEFAHQLEQQREAIQHLRSELMRTVWDRTHP